MLPRQSIQVLDLKIQKKKSEKPEKKAGLTMPDKKKLLELLQGGQPNPEKDQT